MYVIGQTGTTPGQTRMYHIEDKLWSVAKRIFFKPEQIVYETTYPQDTLLNRLAEHYGITKLGWHHILDIETNKRDWLWIDFTPDDVEAMEKKGNELFENWKQEIYEKYPYLKTK